MTANGTPRPGKALRAPLAEALYGDHAEVRFKRAALKVALKRGELPIIPLIEEPPNYLASAKVVELLMALPAHGPVKVERLLKRCQVSPRKTLGGLNEWQRRDLIKALTHSLSH